MKDYSPIKLEIFRSLFASVCEEMGEILYRSSFSPNIKERKDFSCALFNADAEMVSQAAHIPVHLGSMGLAVKETVGEIQKSTILRPKDVLITNDPFRGGTHLPDITVITPLFLTKKKKRPDFYLANRAHHADIGGSAPGSMPISDHIQEEGLFIPPTKLVSAGRLNQTLLKKLSHHVRMPKQFLADLASQRSANHRGELRISELVQKYGEREIQQYMRFLLDYEERLTRSVIREIHDGEYSFEDFLDDDGFSKDAILITLTLTIRGDSATFDFSDSSKQTKGPLNATRAITLACISYAMRCLMHARTQSDIFSLRPVRLVTKQRTVLDASYPRPVAGGNVETSQRIVDVIFGALAKALPQQIPAASCGTMNNIAFGGFDSVRGQNFAYYETIGGGMGGRPHADGLDGIHTHMTNTSNTPIEVLESEFPIHITAYSYRKKSGGKGKHSGGLGLIREFEFLSQAEITLLTERRVTRPYGLEGGQSGQAGKNIWYKNGKVTELPSKAHFHAKKGDRVRIETPGGGGYGKNAKPKKD